MNLDMNELNENDHPLVPFSDKWDNTNAFRNELVNMESRKINLFDSDGVMGLDNLREVIND